ncbi:MAG: TlpA family protein disulfide reductase [Arcobacter sp.]|nr:TlpA family protein disulfide reductase [Arcobacter sp.]
MKIKKHIFLGLLALSLLAGCNKKDNIDENVIAGKQVPKDITLELVTTNGEDVTVMRKNGLWIFKNYPNKIVLVNFFATWCPPCKAEIPHLNNLLAKYNKDFQVLSVVVEENKPNADLLAFIKEHDIKYPIANSKVNFEFANAVGGVDGIPAMFLFNKKGEMIANYVGATQEEILDSDISKNIGK